MERRGFLAALAAIPAALAFWHGQPKTAIPDRFTIGERRYLSVLFEHPVRAGDFYPPFGIATADRAAGQIGFVQIAGPVVVKS